MICNINMVNGKSNVCVGLFPLLELIKDDGSKLDASDEYFAGIHFATLRNKLTSFYYRVFGKPRLGMEAGCCCRCHTVRLIFRGKILVGGCLNSNLVIVAGYGLEFHFWRGCSGMMSCKGMLKKASFVTGGCAISILLTLQGIAT